MIIAKSLLQKCISSVLLKNSKLYFFCKTSERDRFIQAVFLDDLKQISLISKQQRNNFKMIYNLSGEQLSQHIIQQTISDLFKVTASLQFASNQSTKIGKNLIVSQQYLTLINKYYEYLHVGSAQKIRNKALNPNINIDHILPTFIHLGNHQIRKTLKLNQYYLLHMLKSSRKLTLQQIMRIISSSIYNITDLPLVQRIFYQQIYPRVYESNHPQQLLQGLCYLNFFNMMPLDLFQNTIDKIRMYLDETASNKRELKTDFIWLEVMQTLVLKSDRYSSISKKYQALLFHQYIQLITNKHRVADLQCTIQDLFSLQNGFDHLAAYLTQNALQNFIQNSNQNIDIENNLELCPKIFCQLIENHRIIYNQLISLGKMRQYVQLQLWITISKILLCGRALDLNLNNFNIFFSSQKSKNILQKYAYYPNLFKDIIIAYEKIQFQHNNCLKNSYISKQIQQFKQKTNSKLKQLLHFDNQQTIGKYNQAKLQSNTITHQHLWNLNSKDITKKIMHYKQDYTINNLLGMLKVDPNFLQSRMKLTITDHTMIELLDKSTNGESSVGEWDYPHWFPITLDDNSGKPIRVIPRTAFNRFLILPKTANPKSILYIKRNAYILHKVLMKKLKNEQESIR